MSSYTISKSAETNKTNGDCGCPCGCAPCKGGCKLECLERPRYFCGQLLTDADLTALVEWTRARLGLVRYRDGWGVVCGLAVRCNPRKPSSVEIGEGYAVSCCGSDIVVCEPKTVDLSDACRSAKSLCEDPCAPVSEGKDEKGKEEPTDPWSCPDGVWVDIVIDAANEEVAGRPALSTNGCGRIGSCEASRVRETCHATWQPSRGDPLQCAEKAWTARYHDCIDTVLQTPLLITDEKSTPTYGQLRKAVEAFAMDHACEGGCASLRWICRPGAPTDDTPLSDDIGVVDRIRLGLLLDCLVAVGRCNCATCEPGTVVPLARVRVAPGRTAECPCRVIAVDDAPPYRRPLGRDCPAAGLGRVNLGDLIGQRPHGVCLEVVRRGLQVLESDPDPFSEADALKWLGKRLPPIFDCHEAVRLLAVDDECLGPRVVGFYAPARRQPSGVASGAGSAHPLMRLDGMTPTRIEKLGDRGITTLDDFAKAADSVLRSVFRRTSEDDLEAKRKQARGLAGQEPAGGEGAQ